MKTSFDIDAYLDRIGFSGQRVPSLETLQTIHRLHTQTIPFENLYPLLRWPVHLDPRSLQHKLVRDGRGGWCFEHNSLLRHALEALGFRVTGLAARVLWNAPEDALPPRGHMLLRIDLDGVPYLADVGFGGQTLTGPLRLEADIEQTTPHEPFRLVPAGEDFVMQAKIREAWKTLYRFDLTPQLLPDYEVSNWYLGNHPDSHFLKGLIAGRSEPGRRYALLNNELAIHHLTGGTERRILKTADELRQTLENDLRLRLPDAPEVETVLRNLTAAATDSAA